MRETVLSESVQAVHGEHPGGSHCAKMVMMIPGTLQRGLFGLNFMKKLLLWKHCVTFQILSTTSHPRNRVLKPFQKRICVCVMGVMGVREWML